MHDVPSRWTAAGFDADTMRVCIPIKPATDSTLNPATCNAPKPATRNDLKPASPGALESTILGSRFLPYGGAFGSIRFWRDARATGRRRPGAAGRSTMAALRFCTPVISLSSQRHRIHRSAERPLEQLACVPLACSDRADNLFDRGL